MENAVAVARVWAAPAELENPIVTFLHQPTHAVEVDVKPMIGSGVEDASGVDPPEPEHAVIVKRTEIAQASLKLCQLDVSNFLRSLPKIAIL